MVRNREVYFLDTCVPLYAVGMPHPYRDACRAVIRGASRREFRAVTSTEVIQEIAYRFSALERRAEGVQLARDFADTVTDVLPVTREDALRSLELLEGHPVLRPRDALHVAVMEAAGLRLIVTADRHFDGLTDIRRVDPLDFTR